ncbi:MAG: hypothetical protein P1U82_13710, partial [Verrucomicrobiales bacterium]|nr:hypothetical protein [Verrucomicrobiales bacterium]
LQLPSVQAWRSFPYLPICSVSVSVSVSVLLTAATAWLRPGSIRMTVGPIWLPTKQTETQFHGPAV